MKSLLLLILSLMTGCVASFKVTGCQGGWVEFTCNYEVPEEEYDQVFVKKLRTAKGSRIKSTVRDKWEHKDRFSLYHDTKKKTLRVAINHLKPEDEGDYKCQFKKSDIQDRVDFKVEINICQSQSIQTASTKTDITCNYPENYMSSDKFFCKEDDLTCEDILDTKYPPESNERFTRTETDTGFIISINHVSPSDAGVYWCAVQTEHYRAGVKRIQLEVKALAGRSPLTIIIAVVVCAVLAVLVLILVLIYKRIWRLINPRNEEAPNNKEDRTYEEIQERPQVPDSGTAIKTIYTTANFHTNPSPDTYYYSNSSFKNSSVEVSAGDPNSTVNNNDQHQTYSTVNHSSGLSEDPCYSTVNQPQQP